MTGPAHEGYTGTTEAPGTLPEQPENAGRPRGWLSRLIGAYQNVSASTPARCRYVPTCSEYAQEAINTYGNAKGAWLSFRRLCRCHPLGSHGYDPVPEKVEP